MCNKSDILVLVYHDNQSSLCAIENALTELGIKWIFKATTYIQAQQILANHPIGIIVLDNAKKDETFFNFGASITKSYPAAFLMILTTCELVTCRVSALAIGASGFVAKASTDATSEFKGLVSHWSDILVKRYTALEMTQNV